MDSLGIPMECRDTVMWVVQEVGLKGKTCAIGIPGHSKKSLLGIPSACSQ